MAQTPKQFFANNMKWFALLFLFLFLLKTVQSCNRDTSRSMDKKKYELVIDSLNKVITNKNSIIDNLETELKLAEKDAASANEKAAAVQSAVEKMKTNTTITVKGAEEVKK